MSKSDQAQGDGESAGRQGEPDFAQAAGEETGRRTAPKNEARPRMTRVGLRGMEHSSASSRPDDLDADE